MVSSVDGHTKDYVDSKCQAIESQVDGLESNIASLQSVTSELQTTQEESKSTIQIELDSIQVILKKLARDVNGITDQLKDLKKSKSSDEEVTDVTQESEVRSPPLKKRRVSKSQTLKEGVISSTSKVKSPHTPHKKRTTPTRRASTSGRKRKTRVNENRYAELVSNGLIFGTIAKVSSSRANGEQWHTIQYDSGSKSVMDNTKLKLGKRLYSVFDFLDPGKDSKNIQPVPCRMAKHFDACEYDGKYYKAGVYFGTVISFNVEKRKEYWTVDYDEGDDEVMDRSDFQKAVWLYAENKHMDTKSEVLQKEIDDKKGDDVDLGNEDDDDSDELLEDSEEEAEVPNRQKKIGRPIKKKEILEVDSDKDEEILEESKSAEDVGEDLENTQDVEMLDVVTQKEKEISKIQQTPKAKETTDLILKSPPKQASAVVASRPNPAEKTMPPKKREIAPQTYIGRRVAIQRSQTIFRATVKDFGETCGEKCWEVVYDVSNATEAWNESGLKMGLNLFRDVGELKEDVIDKVETSEEAKNDSGMSINKQSSTDDKQSSTDDKQSSIEDKATTEGSEAAPNNEMSIGVNVSETLTKSTKKSTMNGQTNQTILESAVTTSTELNRIGQDATESINGEHPIDSVIAEEVVETEHSKVTSSVVEQVAATEKEKKIMREDAPPSSSIDKDPSVLELSDQQISKPDLSMERTDEPKHDFTANIQKSSDKFSKVIEICGDI